MNIPSIGGARGIFEILVPGVFMLVNLVAVVYLFPFTDAETKRLIATGTSNQVFNLLMAIIFGYLIGVILRMFRADVPDKLSAKWIRGFKRAARLKDGTFKLYATEEFPYIGWIGQKIRQGLPPNAVEFYERIWAPRKIKGQQNNQFFNFCKNMIIAADERCANEIYAAEALSRYIAEMFYALVSVFALMLITIIVHYIVFAQVLAAPVAVVLAYFAAIVGILANYRFIRIKEVETVFAATFKHASLFQEKEPPAPSEVESQAAQ